MILVCHLISQDTWWKVMWFFGCEPLMVSHHPANFGSHRHCGSGDITSFVVEGEIPHCVSLKSIACHAYTHKISGCRDNNLLVQHMILVKHVYTNNWENLLKNLVIIRPKTALEIKKRKKKKTKKMQKTMFKIFD